jgi:hypothetical protein
MATIVNNILHQETTTEAYHKGLPVNANASEDLHLYTSILESTYNGSVAKFGLTTIDSRYFHSLDTISCVSPKLCDRTVFASGIASGCQ